MTSRHWAATGRATTGWAVAAALVMAGCGDGGQPTQSADFEADPARAEATQTGGADQRDAQASSTGDSSAGVAHIDMDDMLASQDVTVPGTAEDTATIGVHSLTVDGKVQVLRLVVTPHFASASDSDEIDLHDVWGKDSLRPLLVDMNNLKEYSVIRDSGDYWVSDRFDTRTVNHKPMIMWAVFAAPEDDNKTYDIRLHDAWPEFTDVPVTR